MLDEAGRVRKDVHEPDSVVRAVLKWLAIPRISLSKFSTAITGNRNNRQYSSSSAPCNTLFQLAQSQQSVSNTHAHKEPRDHISMRSHARLLRILASHRVSCPWWASRWLYSSIRLGMYDQSLRRRGRVALMLTLAYLNQERREEVSYSSTSQNDVPSKRPDEQKHPLHTNLLLKHSEHRVHRNNICIISSAPAIFPKRLIGERKEKENIPNTSKANSRLLILLHNLLYPHGRNLLRVLGMFV